MVGDGGEYHLVITLLVVSSNPAYLNICQVLMVLSNTILTVKGMLKPKFDLTILSSGDCSRLGVVCVWEISLLYIK